MRTIILLSSLFIATSTFAQDEIRYTKKYFSYILTLKDKIVATPFNEKDFDSPHLEGRIKGNYEYYGTSRELMPPISEVLRKHFTREELESLEKRGQRTMGFMQIHFNYYGRIEYVVFFITLKDSEVMTDAKLHTFYEDLKKVSLDVSKFAKWWTNDGTVKEEDKSKIIAFMGGMPFFFRISDVYGE